MLVVGGSASTPGALLLTGLAALRAGWHTSARCSPGWVGAPGGGCWRVEAARELLDEVPPVLGTLRP